MGVGDRYALVGSRLRQGKSAHRRSASRWCAWSGAWLVASDGSLSEEGCRAVRPAPHAWKQGHPSCSAQARARGRARAWARAWVQACACAGHLRLGDADGEARVVEHGLKRHVHVVHDDHGDAAMPHLRAGVHDGCASVLRTRAPPAHAHEHGHPHGDADGRALARTESSTLLDQPSPPGGTMQNSELARCDE